MELTTTSQMEGYLRSNSISYTEIEILNGGGSNYSWRIKSADPTKRSSIIKHATPYLKILKRVSLPIERLEIEAQAISVLSHSSNLQDDNHVGVPALFHFDQEAHVIQISDAGSRNLVEAFTSADLDMPTLGMRIGNWLAQLHCSPKCLNIGDNQLVELSTQHCTEFLPEVLRKHGYDQTVGQRILAFLFDGNEKDCCQCHGDFLPSNIIVGDDKISTPRLTVIDWEWTRRGNGAFDVGLFAGEIWLMEYFRTKRGFFNAFLAAYVEQRPLNLEDSLTVVARLATHITYWASTGKWGSGDECMQIGYELLQRVLERDISWLEQSMVKALFNLEVDPSLPIDDRCK